MTERYTLEQFEADRAARERDQERRNQERRERAEKAAAWKAWKAEGGSEADFERERPKIRDEGRRRRIFERASAARSAQRSSGISGI